MHLGKNGSSHSYVLVVTHAMTVNMTTSTIVTMAVIIERVNV